MEMRAAQAGAPKTRTARVGLMGDMNSTGNALGMVLAAHLRASRWFGTVG